ncbi:hypothetical protein AgCh_031892 [Apium graveolens]
MRCCWDVGDKGTSPNRGNFPRVEFKRGAQRRRIENPDADISNDEAFNFLFQKAAGELTKLYSLALDRHTAFDAGSKYAYDKLDQVDSNALNAQQEVEIEQSANEVLVEAKCTSATRTVGE